MTFLHIVWLKQNSLRANVSIMLSSELKRENAFKLNQSSNLSTFARSVIEYR